MKSFSQLKKDLKVGVVVETVLNRYRPEKNGQKRRITKAQTNAIGFEIPEEERRPDFHGNGDKVLDFVYKILEGGAK